MKLSPRYFIDWVSKHSMRTKLMASFSGPMLLLCIMLMLPVYSAVVNQSRDSALFSNGQSFEQAHSFLSNYIHTMEFVSEQIYYNGDLQRILSSEDFHGNRNIAVQYREYLELNRIFVSAEMSDIIYQAQIYIPEEINYINRYHFSSESALKRRDDYEAFNEAMKRSKLYFTGVREIYIPGKADGARVVSLLRTIRRTDGSSLPLVVQEISILESQIQNVLVKADITREGFVYLMNGRGEIIGASDPETVERLKAAGELPSFRQYPEWTTLKLQDTSYYIRSAYHPTSDWMMVSLITEREVLGSSDEIQRLMVSLTISVVSVFFVISYGLANHYTRRLNKLRTTIERVQQGDFEVSLPRMSEDEIGVLFASFQDMARRLKSLMEQQYQAGQAVQNAELRALQAQINPHILYNTLDLINWEALDHDAPVIAELTYSLARFYRISLNHGRHVVTIEEEIQHVETYVALENFHFNGAIRLEAKIPDEIRELACINIILQPFVENAILHGYVEKGESELCHITITAARDEGDVVLKIMDDGVGITPEQMTTMFLRNTSRASHGYGVKNINGRLKLCYGDHYGLDYSSTPGVGTTVCIRIPAMALEEAEERFAHLSM